MKNETKSVLFSGVFQNPIFVLGLGLCPVIAVSTTVESSLFMGLATLFVLFLSNVIISLIRKFIGDEIRIVAYILIIATLVTVVSIITERFLPEIFNAVGVFLSLITVNCLIMGRAEAFAKNNSAGKSALDGLSMGLGFTGAIVLVGFIRELFGKNSLTIFRVENALGLDFVPIQVLTSVAGGFLVLGVVLMFINGILLLAKRNAKKEEAK